MRFPPSGEILLSLLYANSVLAQIQLYNFTTASTNLSSTCVAVLNQVQNCDPSLEWAGRGRYEADDILQTLCTAACTASLSTWLKRALGACTTRYVDTQGNAMLPGIWVESILENYSLLCQKNGDKFCNAVVRDAAGVNPENQSQTKSAVATIKCDDCFLKQMQTRLQMPLLSNSDMAKTFTSLTSACKKTGFAVTPIAASTAWVTSTTASGATPTPTGCTGTMYTIRSGDTCQSVAAARGISVAGLLTANGLQGFCANFPTSGALCIPTSGRCKTYTVKTGDTCAKIADANKKAWVQIVSWNPVLGKDCGNLGSYIGYPICVSTPGGDWVNPSPVPSTSEATTPLSSMPGTAVSLLPRPTNTGFINGSDEWHYQYGNGTRLDCITYVNGSDFGSSASCADVAKDAGVNATDIAEWNQLEDPCTLDGKLTYCVQRVKQDFTSDVTEYCNLEDTATYGMTCQQFVALWAIDSMRLNDWNPGVGPDCENWMPGRTYCVMARHFRQPGILAACSKFATANETGRLSDPCGLIEQPNGIAHARFVAWNPAAMNNCSGIRYGYDYCVSTIGFKPTYTSYVAPWGATMVPSANAMGMVANMLDETTTPGSSSSGHISVSVSVTSASNEATSSATVQPHFHRHKRVHGHL
ncbi:hypothetical protein AA0119_g7532 [Alternaria tenuissima]|uniref:LysM domain-containing protein n=1 Tax=Alternaria tenuissima TaxID=119927 RepID=A0AB37W908_9PLEO|nr:hypothetical protein AA0115_g10560 [Alternaria tenuissima]RYN97390.1 hypothetical protein AA0119_g7532 [Alternaria tenuissima]RYO20858.1 hypothetical protein AA0121_g3402 [Alternaria tenuissima]